MAELCFYYGKNDCFLDFKLDRQHKPGRVLFNTRQHYQ